MMARSSRQALPIRLKPALTLLLRALQFRRRTRLLLRPEGLIVKTIAVPVEMLAEEISLYEDTEASARAAMLLKTSADVFQTQKKFRLTGNEPNRTNL